MERTAQETQGLYWFGPPLWCNTLLQCLVWWIASWADDDEQYKEERPPEVEAFLCSVSLCVGVVSLGKMISPLLWWLVLFIEALVLFPNIEREGSQQRRANSKGDS